MPAPIQDDLRDKPMSRQRKYQLRKQRAGLCKQCGKPAAPATHCPACEAKRRGAPAHIVGLIIRDVVR